MNSRASDFVHKLQLLKAGGSTQITVDIEHLLQVLSEIASAETHGPVQAPIPRKINWDGGSF